MKKIFIAGSTGFLGQGTTRALLEAGYQVRAMVRTKSAKKAMKGDGIEKFFVDYINAGRLAQGMEGCDAVFNLVGIIREFPYKGITFAKAHQDFTDFLLEACQYAKVRRYIHISVMGVDSGLQVEYYSSKLASEELVKTSGLDWTIFRPSLIFGPGDRFALEFASWMQKRLPIPLIGKGDYQLMPVGRTDLCRGMVKLLFDAKSSNRIYQIGGPQKLSYLETLKIIEKSSGAKMRLMKIPAALILFASAILGRFKWFPVTKDMVRMLLKGSVTEQNDFWSETGIKPASLSEALPEYLLAENSSR